MRNLKKIIMASGAGAILALTGCESMNHHNAESDRSAGRALDDKTITEAVKDDLNREPVYKFNGVDVKTFSGVVQLSGFVDTNEQKQRAAEIAQREPGVAQVVNNITLKPANNLTPTSRQQNWQNENNQQQSQPAK